ncbi:MAG: DUF1802 family protein [Nitrosopumilaceae archaeon]
MNALKEWASVVKALENGNQTLLLRKGGILETASGFELESRKFLLYPTFEHQDLDSLKSQFHGYLADVRENQPRKGFNKISSYAKVIEECDVSLKEKIENLSPFHIFSDSYIEQRMNWMPEKPMKVIFLRVYKIKESETPVLSEYQGCKSWIDINENFEDGKPVLSDAEFSKKLKEFQGIVN